MKKSKTFSEYRVILGSKSPRRQELLSALGIQYTIESKDIPEIFPDTLKGEEITMYLAGIKSDSLDEFKNENTFIITADTVVFADDLVIGKPDNFEHACEMLNILSGRKHIVITGVCVKKGDQVRTFAVSTEVYFKPIDDEDIRYYVENYRPYDKAGAYGIQDWIGLTCIEKINGSYFNVMGLPVKELYETMLEMCNE